MSTFWIEILSKLGEIFSTNNRLIDWSHNFLVHRATQEYYTYKKVLEQFLIVEKGTSEGLLNNTKLTLKDFTKKDFSEKGLAENVNSVKHSVVDQSHTL